MTPADLRNCVAVAQCPDYYSHSHDDRADMSQLDTLREGYDMVYSIIFKYVVLFGEEVGSLIIPKPDSLLSTY